MSVFSDKLDQLMQQRDMSNEELGELVNVNRTTIARWRSGSRSPKMEKLPEIASIFNVDPRIFVGEYESPKSINNIYNQLNPNRQVKVYNYAQHELSEQNKVININERQEDYVYLQSKVSAGTGILDLDPTYGEYVPYEGEVPNHYDLSFLISGNSMVPTFEDGEIIFVEKYPNPINGAIMVVQIDEQAYIKKVYLEKDKLRLVSLNQDYDDILADGNNNIRIVGKVVF
ncbi:MAG: XRE family transcriptional regulator [Tetragenococcus koreensis]|uniref:helix-turn-helix domain-containing protein n=1 Tax=Tetragenococcus koreensis TaxID=290335 RepID=UPI001F29F084|nr:XRE family transcriptional regulator [Tetragenococcus koreensis]MCF1614665.1 XRE family transcriptional regulator [Tetragenococcus koreensis]MCF1624416.1 XRE family transcriptional regulator [Tetragenococcus koreensis]MDN6140667.1 XRE family transcriptional regulator [Tetragenococcus koreensis]